MIKTNMYNKTKKHRQMSETVLSRILDDTLSLVCVFGLFVSIPYIIITKLREDTPE